MNSSNKRKYYETMFTHYPDVLDSEDVRKMLGGISIGTVLKILRDGHLKNFYYREQKYLIPKVWLIDYILSDHYENLKHSLKAQV